jgi:hypothetical protein
MDVCRRDRCQSKAADTALHRQYLLSVDERNRFSVCGLDGCEERYSASCSLCERFFCAEHITIKEDRSFWRAQNRMLSTCPHCWQRRRLWNRR